MRDSRPIHPTPQHTTSLFSATDDRQARCIHHHSSSFISHRLDGPADDHAGYEECKIYGSDLVLRHNNNFIFDFVMSLQGWLSGRRWRETDVEEVRCGVFSWYLILTLLFTLTSPSTTTHGKSSTTTKLFSFPLLVLSFFYIKNLSDLFTSQ